MPCSLGLFANRVAPSLLLLLGPQFARSPRKGGLSPICVCLKLPQPGLLRGCGRFSRLDLPGVGWKLLLAPSLLLCDFPGNFPGESRGLIKSVRLRGRCPDSDRRGRRLTTDLWKELIRGQTERVLALKVQRGEGAHPRGQNLSTACGFLPRTHLRVCTPHGRELGVMARSGVEIPKPGRVPLFHELRPMVHMDGNRVDSGPGKRPLLR